MIKNEYIKYVMDEVLTYIYYYDKKDYERSDSTRDFLRKVGVEIVNRKGKAYFSWRPLVLLSKKSYDYIFYLLKKGISVVPNKFNRFVFNLKYRIKGVYLIYDT